MNTLIKIRPNETIVTYEDPVTNKNCFPTLFYFMKNNKGSIVIIKNHNDIAKMLLTEIDKHDSAFVFFQSELDIDPISNNMVPLHRLASEDEKSWLVENNIPFDMLPILLMKDPIRRWYNFPYKSVIYIERKNKPYFRIVK